MQQWRPEILSEATTTWCSQINYWFVFVTNHTATSNMWEDPFLCVPSSVDFISHLLFCQLMARKWCLIFALTAISLDNKGRASFHMFYWPLGFFSFYNLSIYIFCPIFLVIILLFVQLSFICLACYNPAHCFVYSHHLPRIFIDILLCGLESPYWKGTCPSQNCTQTFFSFLPRSLLIFLSVSILFIGICLLNGMISASQVALVVKNPPANARDVRDTGLIPGLGRSPGGGHSNPLQYSCLENLMDREAWWATVRRVPKSRTQLKRLSTHAHMAWCRNHALFFSSYTSTIFIFLILFFIEV